MGIAGELQPGKLYTGNHRGTYFTVFYEFCYYSSIGGGGIRASWMYGFLCDQQDGLEAVEDNNEYLYAGYDDSGVCNGSSVVLHVQQDGAFEYASGSNYTAYSDIVSYDNIHSDRFFSFDSE